MSTSESTSKVDQAATPDTATTLDSSTKEFQEKYYPIASTSVNKYDPYSLQAAIDGEIVDVSILLILKVSSPSKLSSLIFTLFVFLFSI